MSRGQRAQSTSTTEVCPYCGTDATPLYPEQNQAIWGGFVRCADRVCGAEVTAIGAIGAPGRYHWQPGSFVRDARDEFATMQDNAEWGYLAEDW